MQIPLGEKALIPGKIVHTNEILTPLGDDLFVWKAACDAKEIAIQKIQLIDTNIKSLDNVIIHNFFDFDKIKDKYKDNENELLEKQMESLLNQGELREESKHLVDALKKSKVRNVKTDDGKNATLMDYSVEGENFTYVTEFEEEDGSNNNSNSIKQNSNIVNNKNMNNSNDVYDDIFKKLDKYIDKETKSSSSSSNTKNSSSTNKSVNATNNSGNNSNDGSEWIDLPREFTFLQSSNNSINKDNNTNDNDNNTVELSEMVDDNGTIISSSITPSMSMPMSKPIQSLMKNTHQQQQRTDKHVQFNEKDSYNVNNNTMRVPSINNSSSNSSNVLPTTSSNNNNNNTRNSAFSGMIQERNTVTAPIITCNRIATSIITPTVRSSNMNTSQMNSNINNSSGNDEIPTKPVSKFKLSRTNPS